MKDASLGINLFGKDVSASKTLKNIGKEAGNTGSAFSRIKETMMGFLGAQVFQKLGSEALKFAKESLTAFTDVGKEVKKVMRITGASVEDASKLRFAFMETGLSVDKAQVALKKFATSVSSNSKDWQKLGIAAKDAAGHQRSFNDLLLDTADKFKEMPDGIQKTALATKLFGKSGLDMLPFLNKGKEGLMELEAEAQKYGLVLTKDNMKAVQESVVAHRELHAAVQGLQFQVGSHLTPILTKATVAFTKIFPIVLKYVNPAFKEIGKVLKPVISIFKNLGEYFLNLGKHFATSSASTGKFKDIMKNLGIVFKVVVDFIKNTWIPALKSVWAFLMKYVAPVLLWIIDILAKTLVVAIKIVVTALRWVVDGFRNLINYFRFMIKIWTTGGRLLFNAIVWPYKQAFKLIAMLWNNTIGKLSFKIPSWVPKIGGKGWSVPKIPMLAAGGIVNKPTLAMIGEAGPEAVVPLNKGIGRGTNIVVNVAGSVIAEKDLAVKVRNEIAQLMRRQGAPISALGI